MVRGQVLVLEPRRLAARLAARRVAQELGEKLGETVGYQVRFEEVAGARTRLRFLTEGILTRRLISDPLLAGVDAVMFDEFHERHLETDLALALLRRLQRTKRPDLEIVVMSATLDAAPIAAYLDGCPILRSEGRLFDLVHHASALLGAAARKTGGLCARALLAQPSVGDVLVFLPGAAEIRRAERECRPLAAQHDLLLLPLLWRLAARRAGSRRLPRPAAQGDPFHQRRRKLHHRRRRHGGDRQRIGAHCERFALVRIADARGRAHQQGVGDAARRTGSAHRAGPCDPALYARGFSSPARARSTRDPAARII